MNKTDNPFEVVLKIDPQITIERVEIQAREYSEKVKLVEKMVRLAANQDSEIQQVAAVSNSGYQILPVNQIALFFTQQKKVWARFKGQDFQLRQRLYELEAGLNPSEFIRISQSEIVNLKFVHSLDLSISGTISLRLTDGHKTFVSRRSLSNFKKQLNI